MYVETRTPKRGEVYYIRYDYSVGSEMSVGRPAIVVSNDEGNETSTTYNVLFTTTTPKSLSVCAELNSTKKKSWALCNQIHTVDIMRFGDKMCTLTAAEMSRVDEAMALALGLKLGGSDDDEEVRELEEALLKAMDTAHEYEVEAYYYKKLYEKALNLKVNARIEADTAC